MMDRATMLKKVSVLEQETLPLFVKPLKSKAVLHLMGGFIHSKRSRKAYSWSEHRSWILRNTNEVGASHRGVSTSWKYQVYVVNRTYQATKVGEMPYACECLLPFCENHTDNKDLPLFHKGFICAGKKNGLLYDTAERPEDGTDQHSQQLRDSERFGVKLYFFDKSRLDSEFRRNIFPAGAVNLILTARVQEGEVIGFRSVVRTNVQHQGSQGSHTVKDISFRAYDKDMEPHLIPYDLSQFEQSCGSDGELEEEVRYHNKLHLHVCNAITKDST